MSRPPIPETLCAWNNLLIVDGSPIESLAASILNQARKDYISSYMNLAKIYGQSKEFYQITQYTKTILEIERSFDGDGLELACAVMGIEPYVALTLFRVDAEGEYGHYPITGAWERNKRPKQGQELVARVRNGTTHGELRKGEYMGNHDYNLDGEVIDQSRIMAWAPIVR